MARICLVGCVRSKREEPAAARDLYTSPLFRKAGQYAELTCDRWYVLSAKHHLVGPDQRIVPYEATLRNMLASARLEWARTVFAQLEGVTEPKDTLVILAGRLYRDVLVPLLRNRGHEVRTPLERLSIGKQLQWLNQQIAKDRAEADLEIFYELLSGLEQGVGGMRVLSECTGELEWPERGVYFLFDRDERRANMLNHVRVVRVGTHMVSAGSRATLWNRIRTHRGYEDGTGNHRGSVFRRHVGEAMMHRDPGEFKCATWGEGQSASRHLTSEEVPLERKVSEYIGRMSVLWVAVPDQPSPKSDRAYLEKNALGLLAKAGRAVDPPSVEWLGNHSMAQEIMSSGLWNVDHVHHRYDRRFLDTLSAYVELAAGRRRAPEHSIAPPDWHLADQGKISRGQMFLFEEEDRDVPVH